MAQDEAIDRRLGALECLAKHGGRLREAYRYDWDRQTDEAVRALLMLMRRRSTGNDARHDPCQDAPLTFVAIVGGASSGKSTVFNNLLGGHLASRVTARGHATRGPVAAVHEARRETVEAWLATGTLLPTFSVLRAGLDDRVEGKPDKLCVVQHRVDALRDVVLLDTPDLTSELARLEGDIVPAMLPWFDRLIVLVDHERWFDRQMIGGLREASEQFGQQRYVLFNRGRAGQLGADELSRLAQQADRLGAVGYQVLEYRPGRGCCVFPPGTFDAVLAAIAPPALPRQSSLVRFLGRRASLVLNSNSQRQTKLRRLRTVLDRAAASAVPTRAACFAALLTAEERRHLDVIARTLRITETRQWLARQSERITRAVRRHVPVVGGLLVGDRSAGDAGDTMNVGGDRSSIGWEVFRSRCWRLLGVLNETAGASEFWDELRQWTGMEPPAIPRAGIEAREEAVRAVVGRLDEAVKAWTSKVESECARASPRLLGAVGAASIAGAIVLVAVAGPVAALTLPAIKAALAGALGMLAASAGGGAIVGPSLARLLAVIHERLIGTTEFKAVEAAVGEYRQAIEVFGRAAADESFAAAWALVIPEQDELGRALGAMCDAAEID